MGETGALAPGRGPVSVSRALKTTLKRMTRVMEEGSTLAGHGRVGQSVPTPKSPGRCPRRWWPQGRRNSATITRLFNSEICACTPTPDFVGWNCAAPLKNVYAVGCGVCDGMGLGDNTKAALMTQGLNEMVRIGVAGGPGLDLSQVGRAGDLIVTCTSRHSRNRLLGKSSARARRPIRRWGDDHGGRGGIYGQSAKQLMDHHGLDLPIVAELYAMLYDGKPARAAMQDLLSPPARRGDDARGAFYSTNGGEEMNKADIIRSRPSPGHPRQTKGGGRGFSKACARHCKEGDKVVVPGLPL